MQLNLRSPATQKWIIALMLSTGVVYGYFNFVWTPRRELGKRMAAEIKSESDLLQRGKRIAANFQTVQDDYGRLMRSWDVAHALLPTQKEMDGLLKAITLEGQSRNVNFLLFKPLDPVEKPYYWENPIQIRTLSNYHDLGRFLAAVASMDRIVNINSLTLREYKPKRGASPFTVEADFTASIYIFKELGSPVSVQSESDDKQAPGRPGGANRRKPA